MENNLPKSVKKFIREEKARIRRGFSDSIKRKEEIDKLYKSFVKGNENKRDLQPSDTKGN